MKKVISVLLLCLAVSACADAVVPVADSAGFFSGVWHGLILPFSFIGSLLRSDIGIYETVNNGWPYNLGFLMGVGGLFVLKS